MTRRVFVDTKWNPRKYQNSKRHVCYDPEKNIFFEVDGLIELKDYDEIHLDSSIFPNMWQQLREVISNGKRVYYFTRPWKWKEFRDRFKEDLKTKIGRVSKSDEGDAYLLWKVYELSLTKNNTHRYFRPLTIIDVELRPLLMKERLLYKNLQRVWNASIVGVDAKNDVKMLERMVEEVRREIVDKAIEMIPRFMDIAKYLGLSMDDISGLTGLTGELVYNNSTSNNKSIKHHGLFKAKGYDARRNKRYNQRAQRYLMMLTNTILWKNGGLRPPRYKDLRKVLKMVIEARKQMDSLGRAGV